MRGTRMLLTGFLAKLYAKKPGQRNGVRNITGGPSVNTGPQDDS
jgi:hypothetical protein